MGWFDEQIRQRKLSDQELFEDSIFHMASLVLGKKAGHALNDERVVAKEAIDDILKYYHFKPTEIPDNVSGAEEQLDYCLRPHGIMRRNVKLEKGWYRDAFGPMLGFLREGGVPVALLPRPFSGYWFRDPATGEKRKLDRKSAELFDPDAVCFYRPCPRKSWGSRISSCT